jgi:hypothetical protein
MVGITLYQGECWARSWGGKDKKSKEVQETALFTEPEQSMKTVPLRHHVLVLWLPAFIHFYLITAALHILD